MAALGFPIVRNQSTHSRRKSINLRLAAAVDDIRTHSFPSDRCLSKLRSPVGSSRFVLVVAGGAAGEIGSCFG